MVDSALTTRDEAAVEWLLESAEPGIRLQARRDLLDDPVAFDAKEIASGPMVSALLEGQAEDGGFGNHPYKKWAGAHWRLVSLVELGLTGPEPRALAAVETVLAWLMSTEHWASTPTIRGLARRHASQEGNALAVCVRLGMARDPRVKMLATSLVEWQWPDGGWNCDKTPKATHSSFHESLPPVWGLSEYARAAADEAAAAAVRRAAGFFLEHGLYRSHTTGAMGNPKWLTSPYPAYWHYNVGQALTILARAGALPDPRAADALTMLRDRQQPDGTWHVIGGQHWARSGDYWDPAGWERSGPSQMLTLNALRVLRAAGA